jgi:hypothetical protein
VYLILDNDGTHKHAKVRAWLAGKAALPASLHAHVFVLAQSGRALVRPDYPTSHPSRLLQKRQGTHRQKSTLSSSATIGTSSPSPGLPPPTRSSPDYVHVFLGRNTRRHDVAEIDIRRRYDRSLLILPVAVARADHSILFDNSTDEGYQLVAVFDHGNAQWLQRAPSWAAALVTKL